ncbi:TOBE-like domain-containing protein [Granulosicoccaceae sp. 1_MG-2023]|nr:TOBE-like domain-containing protein [Granulosicoccaceae sp. 1_MG-2023]
MTITLAQVSKEFHRTRVIEPMDLEIRDGEMLALLGPSGSGKTTLLRMIAGLESCDKGRIFFGERDVTRVHVRQRKVGFVFQHYALFEHLTIAENVAFGLEVLPRRQRPDKKTIADKVAQLLRMVRLEHLAGRYPEQLSGGQRQRIALARALATEPDVLLLDEPFGALDAQVRKDLRQWLRRLHDKLGFTSVFVTHDQEEALELSDRVAILHNGRIEQVDTPTRLFSHPANQFVFDFLGHVNRFSGRLNGQHLQQDSDDNPSPAQLDLQQDFSDGAAELYFRSHELELSPAPVSGNNLQVRITAISPVGTEVRISLEGVNFNTGELWETALTHADFAELRPERGQLMYIRPRVGHLFYADQATPLTLHWESGPAKPPLAVVSSD